MSSITLTGLDSLLNLRQKLRKALTGVPNEVRATNRAWVGRLRTALISHSSGRPGPQVITGAYNSNYDVHTADGDLTVEAGNSSPQSDRLEYGFAGVDSAGRHYNQPPFPHFRPTLEEVSEPYANDIMEAFGRWWGGF
jgi:hypothetical protein